MRVRNRLDPGRAGGDTVDGPVSSVVGRIPLSWLLPALTSILLIGCSSGTATEPGPNPTGTGSYQIERVSDPDRVVVKDEAGNWLASFTTGAYTVAYRGSRRSYTQGGRTIDTDTWVRILPQPFNGTVDTVVLAQMLRDTTPDIIEVSMQYITGAPPIFENGLKIAGDADYGDSGMGADFYDYLGINWVYPSGTRRTARAHFKDAVDCSGYVRLVFGYRGTPHKVPLSITVWNTTLPRTSYNQYLYGTGVILIENELRQPTVSSLAVLQPGDLLFFDSVASRDTPGGINHVGIYLGKDKAGRMRFISSLPGSNGSGGGPIFGRSSGNDYIIDGSGFWARALRGARRL